jgi:hypothetical protein
MAKRSETRFAWVGAALLVAGLADLGAQRRVPPPQGQPAQPKEQPPERTAQPRVRTPDSTAKPRQAPEGRSTPRPHPQHPPVATVRPPRVRGEVVFVGGYFYDPYFGVYPWWPRTTYRYFPVFDARAHLRVDVRPKDAAVYVDGFYAGIVDDFDGIMQALPLPPGGHEITVFLDGYRTLTRALYLRPGSTFRLKESLERLPAGARSEFPSVAPALPPPPPGSYSTPRVPAGPAGRSGDATSSAVAFGTLDLVVAPPDARVTVDGRQWLTSDDGHFLVDVPAGTHVVEVSRSGAPSYRREVVVREGETATLNVSLTAN